MITYYGYADGSGEYFVAIDSDKCNGCGKCVTICPKDALQLETMFIDLEDKVVASVKEEHRNKIRYTCSECRPEKNLAPCAVICPFEGVKCIFVVR